MMWEPEVDIILAVWYDDEEQHWVCSAPDLDTAVQGIASTPEGAVTMWRIAAQVDSADEVFA